MAARLSQQETFPYDVLDEIFCFACENRKRRALDLGRVCRFWYERFVRNDRMWAQLSRALVRIPRPRRDVLDTYVGVRRAMEVSKQLAPIRAETLHPINQCPNFSDTAIDIEDAAAGKINSVHMKFRCPLVLEALTLVEPGVAACHICSKRVYKVQNQAELDERARKGDCVWMEHADLDPEADIETDVEIAVFCEDPAQLLTALKGVVADFRVRSRSTSLYPLLAAEIDADRQRGTIRLRLHSFLVPSTTTASPPVGTSSINTALPNHRRDPLPKQFTALWLLAPSYCPVEQQSTWQPNLQALGERFLTLLAVREGALPEFFSPNAPFRQREPGKLVDYVCLLALERCVYGLQIVGKPRRGTESPISPSGSSQGGRRKRCALQ